VSGEAQHPSFSGGVTLANAALGVPDPRIAISGVSGRLTLDDDRLVVSAQGSINGGSLDISGSLPLLGPRASEHAKEGLRLRGQGFVLEWPEGLRSMLDADLAYRADAQGGGVIAGRVSVEPGVYRRTALPLPAGDQSGAADSKSSRFGATRLDVSIATASPGLLDNSLSLIHISEPTRLGMISYAVF